MEILVGAGTCGIAAGASRVIEELLRLKGERKNINIDITGCIGLCSKEVIVEIRDGNNPPRFYEAVDIFKAQRIFKEDIIGGNPIEEWLIDMEPLLKWQKRIALRNCGRIRPYKISDYIANGGYLALKKLIHENLPSEKIIASIRDSGLRGRGGGGFPTAIKWEIASKVQSADKIIICNADEGDPGAFMDRSILEGDPHTVIEGMVIGALAIKANKGYIYVRAEYPLAIERISHAIEEASVIGVIGKNILSSGIDFELTVKEGAGAFVCGEETALIASMEGYRGTPKVRPPYPATQGFRSLPTCINNVETFANIPWILSNGGSAFAKMGTSSSPGTKVFALAGKIQNPGLIEIEMGKTLADILENAGGVSGNHSIKAVQLGGPSGGCIPASHFNTPADYESILQTGAIMGSGGLIVIDETTCMVELARYFLSFTQEESCGKCTFCRVGTKRMLEILERLTAGEGCEADLIRLCELALNIKKSSLCALGQSAPNPVLTTLNFFYDEYISHAVHKKCPAGYCRNLTEFHINESKCKKCKACFRECPVNAVKISEKNIFSIDPIICIKCGKCYETCKFQAIVKS